MTERLLVRAVDKTESTLILNSRRALQRRSKYAVAWQLLRSAHPYPLTQLPYLVPASTHPSLSVPHKACSWREGVRLSDCLDKTRTQCRTYLRSQPQPARG